MRNIFLHSSLAFELTIPEYETANFGYKMSELRFIGKYEDTQPGDYLFLMNNIAEFLSVNNIMACTFRGKEDIKIVQYLNELGFAFIGTFTSMYCLPHEFKQIPINENYKVVMAKESDHPGILALEERVFDYSSYQIDSRFLSDMTAKRNAKRVASYFGNPNQFCFILRDEEMKVIGFIQALCVDNVIDLVNGALDPAYHGKRIGASLYYGSFLLMFNSGASIINTNFCTQNIPVLKIKKACGFRFKDQEIHLRLKL